MVSASHHFCFCLQSTVCRGWRETKALPSSSWSDACFSDCGLPHAHLGCLDTGRTLGFWLRGRGWGSLRICITTKCPEVTWSFSASVRPKQPRCRSWLWKLILPPESHLPPSSQPAHPTNLTPLSRPDEVEFTTVPCLHSLSVDAGRGCHSWVLWVAREGALMKMGVKDVELCREGPGGVKDGCRAGQLWVQPPPATL